MAKDKGPPEELVDRELDESVPEQQESERLSQQRDERDAEWEKTQRERRTVELMWRVHEKRSFPFSQPKRETCDRSVRGPK